MIRTRFAVPTVLGLTMIATTAGADTTINFFGDIDFKLSREGGVTDNTFQATSLDIFASQTEGKFTFVGELVVEAVGDNEFTIDADRLEVAYQPRPWLRFRAGRIRSAFGYYGDAYQNGKFFMVPVAWPEMYEDEGSDGVVPSHSIGVHADGAYELGDQNGKITLDAEVLNGRGRNLDEVPAYQDANNSKAINLRLRYVGQDALDGLIVGGNLYVDDVPADDTVGVEHAAMHELAIGAHAAYVAKEIHAVAEATYFRHREHGTDVVHETLAAFGEIGYSFGDVTPYARYELFRFGANGDPYFSTSGLGTTDGEAVTAGVKYIASASVAVKLQGTVDVDTDTSYFAMTQAAFAF